jgi:hypothetical protein
VKNAVGWYGIVTVYNNLGYSSVSHYRAAQQGEVQYTAARHRTTHDVQYTVDRSTIDRTAGAERERHYCTVLESGWQGRARHRLPGGPVQYSAE